jgi:predicted amidophosphoribosyltransferase
MSVLDDDDFGIEVLCPECGEESYLNPESGLCYDCDQSVGEDEEEGDEGLCPVCGGELDEDDSCPECEEGKTDCDGPYG